MHWRKIHRSLWRLEKWAGEKRNRMKLNREQSTITGERTRDRAGSSSSREEMWVTRQVHVSHFTLLQAKSFVKARTRARPRYLVLPRLQAQHEQHTQAQHRARSKAQHRQHLCQRAQRAGATKGTPAGRPREEKKDHEQLVLVFQPETSRPTSAFGKSHYEGDQTRGRTSCL